MTALFENLNGSLVRLKKQARNNRFFSWWLGELSGMTPQWMRSSEPTIESYALVPLDQVQAQMDKPVAAGTRAVAITLSPRQVLRKTLSLPLATEENLRQVLAFQMEQHTPFPADKVYFAYAIKARDFESRQLAVEFVVVPRDAVDPAIKQLQGLGVEVRALFVEDLIAESRLLNLLPATLGVNPSVLRYGANPWLAGLAALLALAVLLVPPLIKREAVVQLLPWVEKGKMAAEAVSSVRRELEARVEQHNYLLEKRQASPAVIQVMDELTRILPDDTWIQVFDLKGKKLQIQGETASSSRLIGLFEKSSIFREASLSSASFKGQIPGTERYQLEIQLRSTGKPDVALPPGQAASAARGLGGKSP